MEKRRWQVFLSSEAEDHLNDMWDMHKSVKIKNYSNLINYIILHHKKITWENEQLIKEIDTVNNALIKIDADKNAYRENRNKISKQIEE